MSRLFKRTKILATIGPAVNSADQIEELFQNGVNGYRLNFSHGSNPERDQQIAWIRQTAKANGRSVAILQDLQGPKIRLGKLKNNHFDVKAGDELILDFALQSHDGSNTLPIQYNLAERMQVGEPIFMFDGKIKASVIDIPSETAIKIQVENDGFLMSNKGVNVPDTDFSGDIITEKDLEDIEFGATREFDYVALSFVQSADDIEKLRQILLSHGSTAQIIAKIETKKAIESNAAMEAIVEASDGIMVARGDLAVEAGNEVVPIVQQKLIAMCRERSKICIVATQMLSSMVENPEPTRAEVSDVSTAVIQGADAVMLSDETANGKYPISAVAEMRKIILYTQNHSRVTRIKNDPTGNYENYDAISEAVSRLAEKIAADVIVCQTESGYTAAAIAAQRPNVPIISVTGNQHVANQLALTYANSAFVRPYNENYGANLAIELKESGYLQTKPNQSRIVAVIVSGKPNTVAGTDTIQIRRI